ncbi:MAG: hypothetical protein AAGB12_14980 [Pseudomonadota bacterium]
MTIDSTAATQNPNQANATLQQNFLQPVEQTTTRPVDPADESAASRNLQQDDTANNNNGERDNQRIEQSFSQQAERIERNDEVTQQQLAEQEVTSAQLQDETANQAQAANQQGNQQPSTARVSDQESQNADNLQNTDPSNSANAVANSPSENDNVSTINRNNSVAAATVESQAVRDSEQTRSSIEQQAESALQAQATTNPEVVLRLLN